MTTFIFELLNQCGGFLAETRSIGFSTKSKIYGNPVILRNTRLSICLESRPNVPHLKVSRYDGILFYTCSIAPLYISSVIGALTLRKALMSGSLRMDAAQVFILLIQTLYRIKRSALNLFLRDRSDVMTDRQLMVK